jgi:predicted nucleotidyltransferase
MDRKEIVNKAEQAIRAVEPDAEIILFGSEARGDARPGSDIDLLVLLSGDKLSFDRESVICGDLLLLEGQTGISISPKIYLKKNWENRPVLTPFYMNVMREGIWL